MTAFDSFIHRTSLLWRIDVICESLPPSATASQNVAIWSAQRDSLNALYKYQLRVTVGGPWTLTALDNARCPLSQRLENQGVRHRDTNQAQRIWLTVRLSVTGLDWDQLGSSIRTSETCEQYRAIRGLAWNSSRRESRFKLMQPAVVEGNIVNSFPNPLNQFLMVRNRRWE